MQQRDGIRKKKEREIRALNYLCSVPLVCRPCGMWGRLYLWPLLLPALLCGSWPSGLWSNSGSGIWTHRHGQHTRGHSKIASSDFWIPTSFKVRLVIASEQINEEGSRQICKIFHMISLMCCVFFLLNSLNELEKIYGKCMPFCISVTLVPYCTGYRKHPSTW